MGDYPHTNKGATMAVAVPPTNSILSWTMTRSFLSLRTAYWTCGLLPSTAVRSRCSSTDSSGSGQSTMTTTSSGATGRSVSWLDVYPTVREIRDDIIITDHATVPLMLRPAPFSDDVLVDGRRALVERHQQQRPEHSPRPANSSHDHHERSRSVGATPPPIARSFADDYVLTRPMFRRTCDDRSSSSSSNGRLWECVHRRTGRPYCVKMLRDDETEALRLAAVQSHGNICRYHDCLVHHESYCLIMDLHRDGTLSDYNLRRGKLSEEIAVLWIAQILRAVQYLHTVHHLAHGRLTPDHILLRRRRRRLDQVGGDKDKGGDDDDGSNVELVIAGFGASRYIDDDEDEEEDYSTSLAATAEDDMYNVGELSHFMLLGDFSVNLSNLTGLSRTAKQFLVLLLHPDPTVRLTATEALSHDFIRRPPRSLCESNDNDDEAEDHSGREVVVMDRCRPHDPCLHHSRRRRRSPPSPPPPPSFHAKGTLCKSSWHAAIKYTVHDDDDDDGRSFSLASTSSSSTSVQ